MTPTEILDLWEKSAKMTIALSHQTEQKRILTLIASNKVLMEMGEFYADTQNYTSKMDDFLKIERRLITEDLGLQAREALKKSAELLGGSTDGNA